MRDTMIVAAAVVMIVAGCAGAQTVSVDGAVAALQSADPAVRAKAACDLKERGRDTAKAIPHLVAALGDGASVSRDVCGSRNWNWHWGGDDSLTTPGREAAAALVAIGSPAFDPLVKTLQDPRWIARANAVWALGALDDGRAVDHVIAALRDTEALVRRDAAWALGALDDRRGVEPLLTALRDAEARVRAQAAWALGAIGDDRGVDGLVAAVRDADAHVRSQAAWALGAIGSPRASDALMAALKDSDTKVRRQAAWALSAIDR